MEMLKLKTEAIQAEIKALQNQIMALAVEKARLSLGYWVGDTICRKTRHQGIKKFKVIEVRGSIYGNYTVDIQQIKKDGTLSEFLTESHLGDYKCLGE